MRKRRRVEPRALLSPLERFLAQSKVFEDSVVPFCDLGWLANLASTCKAAAPAMYGWIKEKPWKISTLLSRNSTWSLFPARMAYVRWVITDVGFKRLPRGLTGVELVDFTARVPAHYGMFPAGLKYLNFDSFPWGSPLPALSSLPSTLVELEFQGTIENGWRAGLLPNGLRRLKIGAYKGKLRKRVLPPSLIYLCIRINYEPLTKGVLPAGLVTLKLGGAIEEGSLSTLNALKTLVFGNGFNQPLQPGMFPPGLTSLTLGEDFDQQITAAMLPKSLKKLVVLNEYAERRTSRLQRARPKLNVPDSSVVLDEFDSDDDDKDGNAGSKNAFAGVFF